MEDTAKWLATGLEIRGLVKSQWGSIPLSPAMAKKSKFTVPYRKSDGYVPRSGYGVCEVARNPDLWEESDPRTFEETMTVAGICGTNFHLVSSAGVSYDMFPSDFVDMIKTTTLFHGVVSGRWTHVKRCYTFGLKYLGPIT